MTNKTSESLFNLYRCLHQITLKLDEVSKLQEEARKIESELLDGALRFSSNTFLRTPELDEQNIIVQVGNKMDQHPISFVNVEQVEFLDD